MINQIQVSKNSFKKRKVSGRTNIKKNRKKRISNAYWVWFRFSKFDTKKLNKIKRIVNNHLKGPNFSIHLTTIGPFLKLDKKEFKKLEKISRNIKKFRIELIGYKFSNQKFTSFYIKVRKTKYLIKIKNKFSKTKYKKQNKKYSPHLSLYYGIRDNKIKENVIKKLPKLNKFVTIDKICIVDVNEKINKWKIIKTIKLTNEKN